MTCSIFLLAAALSAGNIDFDRTATEGAARISLARSAADLMRTGMPTGTLTRAMIADPKRFRLRTEAETICRDLYETAIAEAMTIEANAVRQRLGLSADFALPMPEEAHRALTNRYSSVFATERQAAILAQAQELVATTRPTEEELETKSEADLRRDMTARILSEQKTAVFEENTTYITESLVAPILASGMAERNRQREYVKRARSEAMTPTKLRADLERKLTENVSDKMKGVTPTRAWGVFPSVRSSAIDEQVERRLTDRLARTIDESAPDVTPDVLVRVMEESPSDHVKVADSERIFMGRFEGQVKADALRRSLQDLEGDERAELEAFVTAHLGADVCRKAVERVIRREVRPKWRQARAEVARRLAEKLWPMLTDGTWFPDAELADRVSARSDFDSVVRAWRKLPEMASLAQAAAQRPVPEESGKTADEKVAAAFARARNAIAAQNGAVDASQPEILALARQRTMDLRSVEKALLEATADRWDAQRLDVLWPTGTRPRNAAEQHAEIFPSVLKKIELVARQILAEIAQERQEKKDASEASPKDPPQPDPDENELLSLSVRRTASGVEVKLMQGKTVIEESRVPATAKDFRKAMEKLTQTLTTKLL